MVEQPGEVEGERGCVSRWCSAPWTATCRKAILTLPVVKHASTNLYRYEATYRVAFVVLRYRRGLLCAQALSALRRQATFVDVDVAVDRKAD